MTSLSANPRKEETSSGGWKLVQSIAMELDTALAIAGGRFMSGGLTPDVIPLRQANSQEWMNEWDDFYGSIHWYNSVLESAAILAGVLDESDYSRATMAIRTTTIDDANKRVNELAAGLPQENLAGLDMENALVKLYVRYRKSSFEAIQLAHPNDTLFEDRLIREVQLCLDILKGGKWHDRFWHWLDRFYYEVYRQWREDRLSLLNRLEQKLVTMLGESQRGDKVPDLQWLSDVNPALRFPEIGSAIQSGGLIVNFWLEPFEFADTFLLLPGQVYLSFAEPGQMYENFLAYTRNLGEKAQALADPTRLIILRLIRAFSMTNTDMAAYLGLARPTVSIHAKVLREAGLIRSWEDGRITRHEIDPAAVRKLFRDLEDYLDLPQNNLQDE